MLCANPEGWAGGAGGAGGEVQEGRVYAYIWPIHIVIQQKLAQHCKAIILE